MLLKPALFAMVIVVATTMGHAQEQPPVEQYVAMIESGQSDPIKSELPTLLAKYPGNPGVLYVKGLLTTEGAEAVRIYQGIVDNYPRSEWADDALYKVHQFYQAIGLYRTADLKLTQLKKEYPTSKYLLTGDTAAITDMPKEDEPPSASSEKAQSPPVAQGQFSLQVGAYTTTINAEKQKLFFEDLGYPVEVINKVKDGRSLYTVNIGNFQTYDQAKAKSAEIRKKYNIDSFVVAR
jgi:hypothetical protein